MSGSWADHIARVNGFIEQDRAAKAARRKDTEAARLAAMPATAAAAPAMPDGWMAPMATGGAQGGMDMPAGNPGNFDGLSSMMGLNPQSIGGLLGALGGGLLGGPFGGLAGALGGRLLGGMLGPQTPAGVAQPVAPGFMGGNDGAFGGGAGVGTFGGGLGDVGTAGMGLGVGGLGAMSGNDIMGFQKGGYTGSGQDGVVQPDRPAGIVHEGELVIPHHVVRRLMGRGMLG